MKNTQKRDIPEFEAPEKQCIECVHDNNEPNSEAEIKSIKTITKFNFKDLLPDYLYEINFPKDSKLQEVKTLSTPNIYSISFPGSLTTIKPNSFKKCEFLQNIIFLKNENNENNLSIIGDHAFDKTMIQSLIIPEKIKQIGSFCFPSTLKQIDFENGAPYLDQVKDNAFKNTQIESINMPLNIVPFAHSENIFKGCKNLKNIIFDSFVNKKEQNLNNENTEIKDLAFSLMLSQTKLHKIELFTSNVNYFLFYNTPFLNEIVIPKSDNSYFIKQDGCLYTKDKKKLIVAERNVKNVKICPECQIITNYAFNVKSLEKVSFDGNSELKEISFLAFYESQIKDIDIPDTVTSIAYGSFLKCRNLESVKISRSLNCIDDVTFSYTNLREITIPRNITVIGAGCFLNCTQLQIVKFENDSNLSEIKESAFSSTKIESISIPKSVKKIGNHCFGNCYNLKSIEFDASQSNLIKLGDRCFQNTLIEKFQLPQKIKKFDFTFTNAVEVSFAIPCSLSKISNLSSSKIKQISIPSSVETICSRAFLGCTQLTEVKINDYKNSKLRKIDNHAFYNCENLKVFELPENVKYFGICSFKNCINYNAKIKLTNDEEEITICKNSFNNSGIVSFESKSKSIKVESFAFMECQKLTNFSAISSKDCILGSSSFAGCESLKTVNLSLETEVEIGKSCFINSSIERFEVPYHTRSIPKDCFKNCTQLSDIIINENCEIIEFGEEAFSKSGIESIFIPSKTEKINKLCFSECKSLRKLTFSNEIQKCKICEKAFYMSGVEQLVVPNGIETIEISCFKKCAQLKQVDFTNNKTIKKIMAKAFKSSGVESLTTSTSISLIGESAFENCQQLRKVNLLGDEVLISPFAFADCQMLQEVKYELSLKIKYIIYSQYSKFDTVEIELDDDEINKELIEPLFISKEPLFHAFTKFYSGFLYTINEKWNSNKVLLDTITSFVNIKTDEKYILENKDNIYYTNGRKDLIFCDFLTESVKIVQETENIFFAAFRYSLLKKIDFEANSNLKIIDNFAFEQLQIEEISLPDSLIIIGNFAFNHCHLLKKVNINPNSKLEKIGKYAFCETAIESILFPSTLTKVDDFAFYQCYLLKSVDNHSNGIKFKGGCFSKSSIEDINFPQNSIFCKSSFKFCYKLRKLNFLKEPTSVKFEDFSFAFSGIEKIIFKCDVIINENVFQGCKSLKKVILNGSNNQISANSFSITNIDTLIIESQIPIWNKDTLSYPHLSNSEISMRIKTMMDDPMYYQYFRRIVRSNIEKLSLNIIIKKAKKDTVIHKLFLNHNCYVVNNTLVYANMINNVLLFEKQSEEEEEAIKKNEILHVPSNAKRFNFPTMSHIKKIKWGTNCAIEDIGPPGFFSYYNLTQIIITKLIKSIPPHLFEHCHFLSSVSFEKGSMLEDIGEFAFAHTRVTKVVFPSTLKTIGNFAFYDNKYLREVVFDGQIIGDEAFANTGITSFKLSNNVTTIGASAFQYCHSLTKFDIDIEKSNLTDIGAYAFSESSINEIKIPPKVKAIKKFVFNGCKCLKEVIFSSNSKLDTVRCHSFSGNVSLEKINMPNTINKLSYKAFINTPLLQSIMNESNKIFHVMENMAVYANDGSLVFVPRTFQQFEINKNCSIIRSSAFCGPNLNEITFPINALIEIESFGFAHCTGLKEITIPSSVQVIGDECFIGCENLEKVKFGSQSKIEEIPRYCFAFCGLKSIDFPKSLKIINHSSFILCQNLRCINLLNTKVNFIGDYSFSETNIKEVKFPSSLRFIGNNAFGGNKSLEKIDFSEIQKIKDMECRNIATLKDIFKQTTKRNNKRYILHTQEPEDTNKEDIKIDENKSFDDGESPSLQTIMSLRPSSEPDTNNNVNEEDDENSISLRSSSEPVSSCFVHKNAFINITAKVFKFNIKEYVLFDFVNSCSGVDKYIINDDNQLVLQKSHDIDDTLTKNYFKVIELKLQNLEAIPLLSNQLLTEFSIPKTIKILNPYQFSNCINLTHIEFENGTNIRIIPNNCFASTPLKKITIPASVCIIGKSAFFSCLELEEVTFSNDRQIKIIKENAFGKCEKLTKIEIPKNLKLIPKGCFSFTALKSIEIPNSVTKIDSNAFYNCKELSQIILNDGLQEISDMSFAYNVSLQSIDLPDTLTIIKKNAFFNCSNLVQVKTTEKTQLVEIHDHAFRFTQIEELSINSMATKIFDPINVPKLNKISFYGKPINFIQLEDGTIYEKDNKFNVKMKKSDIPKLEEKVKTDLLRNVIISNNYYCKSYYLYKDLRFKDNSDDYYMKQAFNIIYKRNRSKFSEEESREHPILKLLFAPSNINTLKIHEDCFSISNSIVERIKNFTTIEYTKGTTNFIFDLHNFDHIKGKINTVKILGDYSYIMNGVFSHLESLEVVEFGPKTSILYIPKHAFLGCKKLNKIVIPSSCISIEEGAFKDCISLSAVEFGPMNSSQQIKYIRKEAFYNCSSLEQIEIPSSVLAICEGSFMNCAKLQSINIARDDAELEIIGLNAFRNCTSLKSFILPKTCIILGPSSFMNCTSLEHFEYEGSYLFAIQSRAFCNCTSLKAIKMINLEYKDLFNYFENNEIRRKEYFKSFFRIESEAFMNCASLTEVVIEDQSKQIDTIFIDEKGELDIKILDYYFQRKFITLRQSILKGAFCNCKSLKRASFFLGNLEHFDKDSFMNCSSLKSIEINSQFSRYLLSQSMYLDPFTATSDDLEIKLFNRDKCIKTINASSIRPKQHRKRLYKNFLSSLNKLFVDYQSSDKDRNEIE